jgi:hypothetical protein
MRRFRTVGARMRAITALGAAADPIASVLHIQLRGLPRSLKYVFSAVSPISNVRRPTSFSVRFTRPRLCKYLPRRPTSWYEQSNSDAMSAANICFPALCSVRRIPRSVCGRRASLSIDGSVVVGLQPAAGTQCARTTEPRRVSEQANHRGRESCFSLDLSRTKNGTNLTL